MSEKGVYVDKRMIVSGFKMTGTRACYVQRETFMEGTMQA